MHCRPIFQTPASSGTSRRSSGSILNLKLTISTKRSVSPCTFLDINGTQYFLPSKYSHFRFRGDDVAPLISHNRGHRYDLVILSEVLWRDTYPLQRELAQSVAALVKEGGFIVLTVVHRPCEEHSVDRDLEFIRILQERSAIMMNKLESSGIDVGSEEMTPVYTYLFQSIP